MTSDGTINSEIERQLRQPETVTTTPQTPPQTAAPTSNTATPRTPPSAGTKAPPRKSAAPSQPLNYAELGGLQQLIAMLFMAFAQMFNPNDEANGEISQFIASVMGFENAGSYKDWYNKNGGNWKENYDFNKFDFGRASQHVVSSENFPKSGDPDFDEAVKIILVSEGVLSNDPNDRGGLTKYGISSRANPDIDVANLTPEGAVAIYKERYWDPVMKDAESQGINLDRNASLVLFDTAVNQGVGYAKKLLRETGGDTGKMLQTRHERYEEIAANDPSQRKFLKGWHNRLDNLADHMRSSEIAFKGEPDGIRDALSAGIQAQAENAMGTRYNLYSGYNGADRSQSTINCSGFTAEAIESALDHVKGGIRVEAADGISTVSFNSRDIMNKAVTYSDAQVRQLAGGNVIEGLDENSIQAAMVIGINTGNHGWERNAARKYGIDHVVITYTDQDTGRLMIAESASSKGGVHVSDAKEWINRANAKGYKVYAADLAQQARVKTVEPAPEQHIQVAVADSKTAEQRATSSVKDSNGIKSDKKPKEEFVKASNPDATPPAAKPGDAAPKQGPKEEFAKASDPNAKPDEKPETPKNDGLDDEARKVAKIWAGNDAPSA